MPACTHRPVLPSLGCCWPAATQHWTPTPARHLAADRRQRRQYRCHGGRSARSDSAARGRRTDSVGPALAVERSGPTSQRRCSTAGGSRRRRRRRRQRITAAAAAAVRRQRRRMPSPDGDMPMTSHNAPARRAERRAGSARHDRPALIAFVDRRALRRGAARRPDGSDHRGPRHPPRRRPRRDRARCRRHATPQVLVVDVSGEEQPLTALGELSHVVEPDVCVLVIGEIEQRRFLSRGDPRPGRRRLPAEAADARQGGAAFRRRSCAARRRRPRACSAAARSPSPACAAASARPPSRSTWRGISASGCAATPCCWIPTCISAPPRSC